MEMAALARGLVNAQRVVSAVLGYRDIQNLWLDENPAMDRYNGLMGKMGAVQFADVITGAISLCESWLQSGYTREHGMLDDYYASYGVTKDSSRKVSGAVRDFEEIGAVAQEVLAGLRKLAAYSDLPRSTGAPDFRDRVDGLLEDAAAAIKSLRRATGLLLSFSYKRIEPGLRRGDTVPRIEVRKGLESYK